jgi:hypothetical protein
MRTVDGRLRVDRFDDQTAKILTASSWLVVI